MICHVQGRVLPPGRECLEHARCKSQNLRHLKAALCILDSEIASMQTSLLQIVPKKASVDIVPMEMLLDL